MRAITKRLSLRLSTRAPCVVARCYLHDTRFPVTDYWFAHPGPSFDYLGYLFGVSTPAYQVEDITRRNHVFERDFPTIRTSIASGWTYRHCNLVAGAANHLLKGDRIIRGARACPIAARECRGLLQLRILDIHVGKRALRSVVPFNPAINRRTL